MRILKAYSALVISIILTGCVLSLEPFYTKESVIEMPSLNGKWALIRFGQVVYEDNKDVKTWIFEDDKILTFGHVLVNEEGTSGMLGVTYFNIGGLIFADTVAGGADTVADGIEWSPEVNDVWSFHLTGGHLLSRIEVKNSLLTVIPLNHYWFKNFIQDHPIASHVKIEEYTTLVVNASPQDWVEFLKKYGADEEAFPKSDAMVFIRLVDEKVDN